MGRLARRLVDAGVAVPRLPPAAPAGSSGTTTATVTVVIPVHDRQHGLNTTLAALGTVPVVVVDDASPSPIAAPAAGDTVVTVVRRGRRGGPAAARNSGWRSVDTEVVAFVDADCVPDPGWLEALLPHFDDPSLAAVAPRITAAAPPAAAGPGSRAFLRGRRFRPGVAGAVATYDRLRSPLDMGPLAGPVRTGGRISYVPSTALLIRRRALASVGGFDEGLRFGEDVDLVWRLEAGGWRIRYDPSVHVSHPTRATAAGWLRQRYDYGTSAAPLAARHGQAVAPVRSGLPTLAAWALAACGPPTLAVPAAVAVVAATTLRIRARTGLPVADAARLAVAGHRYAGSAVADALRRTWWPLTAAAGVGGGRRGRRVVLRSAAAALLGARSCGWPGTPASWVALRLADDVAYGTGVWVGVLRARSIAALTPQVVRTAPPQPWQAG